jgi:small subunit ribosomal protein S18
MTKIFVGNFSFAITDDKLRDYFSKCGTAFSAKVMTEGQGGRSRGFGFVEMSSPEEAQKAISELDGSVWEGRVIKVSEDRSARRHQGEQDGGGVEISDDHSAQRSAPVGYFRAQPLDLGVRRRRKIDPFIEDPKLAIDYKDPKLLSRFMSERGRILPRRMTGLSAYHQRQVARAIRRAQHVGLLPFVRM